MTTCAHLFDDTGLQCTREDHPLEPRGHVYDAGDVPDRHSESSGE